MNMQLRTPSWRPEVLVDERGRRVTDGDGGTVGIPGPLGRERVTTALPLNGSGPVQVAGPPVVHSNQLSYLADADGTLIGTVPPVWIHRLLPARWTEDTRRLGG